LSIVKCRDIDAKILDEHRAEDSMKREAAHDSRARLAIDNDSRRSFRSDTRPGGLPLLPARRAAPAGRIKVPGAILRALTRLRIEL